MKALAGLLVLAGCTATSLGGTVQQPTFYAPLPLCLAVCEVRTADGTTIVVGRKVK